MRNKDLAKDYCERSKIRLKAIKVLFEEKSYADVIRESQEVVELCLKGLLRHFNLEFPRTHDVSQVLEKEINTFPKKTHDDIHFFARVSKSLRRDREIAFYGLEDLVPSEFYSKEDAEEAFRDATSIQAKVEKMMNPAT